MVRPQPLTRGIWTARDGTDTVFLAVDAGGALVGEVTTVPPGAAAAIVTALHLGFALATADTDTLSQVGGGMVPQGGEDA